MTAMDSDSKGDETAEAAPLDLCRNYVYRGRCGYADCCFVHDDLARQQAKPPVPDPPNKSVMTSRRSATEGEVVGQQGMPASIRYLLDGESVRRNPYLKEFSDADWLPRLLAAPECSRLFNVQGKRLRKELTEAFGLLHACRRALKKLQEDNDSTGGVTIVDLCCGKGFSSLVLACCMPEATVLAVDRNPKMDLSHFKVCDNLRFQHMDLESPNLAADLAATLEGSTLVLLVGVHLCGMLSIYATRLFKQVALPVALILAPCCLDKRLPGIKQRAKRLRVDPYTYWCITLLMEELPVCRRELLQDDDVLSERNSFILGVKTGTTG